MLEDNQGVIDSMSRALNMRGHEVTVFTTVQKAISHYLPDLYDAMIIDYELPDGTGLDFLEQCDGEHEITILFSGLDRSRELAAAAITVDHQINKSDPLQLFEVLA